jgi:hypothetical protein
MLKYIYSESLHVLVKHFPKEFHPLEYLDKSKMDELDKNLDFVVKAKQTEVKLEFGGFLMNGEIILSDDQKQVKNLFNFK